MSFEPIGMKLVETTTSTHYRFCGAELHKTISTHSYWLKW